MEKSFPKLDLVYFKMRAFTEAIQMQLCYGNVPYTYHMAWEYFEKSWPEMKKEIGHLRGENQKTYQENV